MDDAGITMQVPVAPVAFGPTARLQRAPEICRNTNDFLYKVIQDHPHRFAGFCDPCPRPRGARLSAAELRRSVEELGMKGGMIHGPSGGASFVDIPSFARSLRRPSPGVQYTCIRAKPTPKSPNGNYAPNEPDASGHTAGRLGLGIENGTQGVRNDSVGSL